MKKFEERLAQVFQTDEKILDELIEQYVLRPSFMPDQDMTYEDVAFREGQRALIQYFAQITRGHDGTSD